MRQNLRFNGLLFGVLCAAAWIWVAALSASTLTVQPFILAAVHAAFGLLLGLVGSAVLRGLGVVARTLISPAALIIGIVLEALVSPPEPGYEGIVWYYVAFMLTFVMIGSGAGLAIVKARERRTRPIS